MCHAKAFFAEAVNTRREKLKQLNIIKTIELWSKILRRQETKAAAQNDI